MRQISASALALGTMSVTGAGAASRESLTKLVLEGESHTSVVPVALTRGLRAIYTRGVRREG